LLSKLKCAAAILCTSGAFGAISTAPASATVYAYYNTNPGQACREQGHVGASVWNNTPYGWYCYDLSFGIVPPSASFKPAGGIDFQGWCSRHYPRSVAMIVAYNLNGWRCRR
jgi:hypothetical protein